jgi:glycolate oxidase iron-sulfur subunit
MHCGLCLPTCPTYEATQIERHSPRGRIALMRAAADDRYQPGRTFGEEMYFCLGCLACATACPAGVDYAHLFEEARAEVEEKQLLRYPWRSLIRHLTLCWLFMDLRWLRLLAWLLRLYQRSGAQKLLRASGLLRCLSRRWRELEAMTPDVRSPPTSALVPAVLPARTTERFRVGLLSGCAQDVLFGEINRDTAEVLALNGCTVVTPKQQSCCGSLHAHNGEHRLAAILARRNIDQFPPQDYDAIISNAGGCGSHLKHYSRLLADDPVYRDRAHLWDRKVRDIHEWLIEIDVRPPRPALPGELVTTYHESCHLAHGQKITRQPRELLQRIPGLRLVELPESAWCCGSAGIYNLTQPEMARALVERKLRHILSTGAPTVATANPGCLLQLIQGAEQRGFALRVVHPVTLLAEAYRRENVVANP